jgi:hypothetical protein
MSAPVRVKVEAEVNTATQELWRLAETPAGTDASEQLEPILARGADINARNSEGATALMMAAYNGRLPMVRALIDHGADLNATREYGFTPLALAAFRGHTDVVRVLVEQGADLNKATPFGTSAEAWATARSFSEIAQYLERAGSAPESSVPEGSANELGLMPSLSENEPGDEISRAESIRAEQPMLADSEFTMETPRSVFSDQLNSQHLEKTRGTGQEIERAPAKAVVVNPNQFHPDENPEPGQENEHASAKPLVVRTLKDPPEIWDLVHEAPQEFHPGGAFVTRLTSSRANLILLTLAIIFIAGLSAFALMRLRDDRKRAGAAAQVQDERGSSQTVPASQASAPVNASENMQLNSQLNTAPSAGAGVDNTPAQQTNSQPTNPQSAGQPDNTVSSSDAVTSGIEPTGVSVSNISKRTAWRVSRAQNADKRPARGGSEIAASPVTNARPQPPQAADLNESTQKSSRDSASATKRSNITTSPQSSAAPTTSSTPKAKVIQWP